MNEHFQYTSREPDLLKICLCYVLLLDNGWKKAGLAYLFYVSSFATDKKPLEPGLKDIGNGTHTEVSTLSICDVFAH